MTLPPQLPPTPGTDLTRQSPAVSGAAFLMPVISQDGAMVFVFFKQKTAYEMLRSLVGSEMCIRDRDSSPPEAPWPSGRAGAPAWACLLYTSDAADDLTRVDLGGRRIIKKKKKKK